MTSHDEPTPETDVFERQHGGKDAHEPFKQALWKLRDLERDRDRLRAKLSTIAAQERERCAKVLGEQIIHPGDSANDIRQQFIEAVLNLPDLVDEGPKHYMGMRHVIECSPPYCSRDLNGASRCERGKECWASRALGPAQAQGEDAKDAERYRWLRDHKAYVAVDKHHANLPIRERTGWTIRLVTGNDDNMDAAIDAAMSGKATERT